MPPATVALQYFLMRIGCNALACIQCGKQLAFAKRSMASWYLVGIPLAALFVLKWGWALRGQWIGMAIGNTVSVASVAIYCNGLDMQKVSDEAVAKAKKKAKGTG